MAHQPVIDGLEFARAGSKLQGAWPVADFARLRDALHSKAGTLLYELQGVAQDRGRPALSLRVGGTLQLVCQRCLGALEFPLNIAVSLHLAATQDEIDAEPLQAEGPDRIVAGREMPVRDLIEDELLLAIPIAPRHGRCAGGASDSVREQQLPFAGLRNMFGGAKH